MFYSIWRLAENIDLKGFQNLNFLIKKCSQNLPRKLNEFHWGISLSNDNFKSVWDIWHNFDNLQVNSVEKNTITTYSRRENKCLLTGIQYFHIARGECKEILSISYGFKTMQYFVTKRLFLRNHKLKQYHFAIIIEKLKNTNYCTLLAGNHTHISIYHNLPQNYLYIIQKVISSFTFPKF